MKFLHTSGLTLVVLAVLKLKKGFLQQSQFNWILLYVHSSINTTAQNNFLDIDKKFQTVTNF